MKLVLAIVLLVITIGAALIARQANRDLPSTRETVGPRPILFFGVLLSLALLVSYWRE